MEEMLFFIFIYTILVFIWSYTVARRKRNDKATMSFLLFLGIILLWMVLSISNFYGIDSKLYIGMQKIYWIVMLNMATVFMYFTYRLINRKLDWAFYSLSILNTATIIVRYFLEMDYSQSNFWRLDDVKIATTMATIFTMPMLWAIILIVLEYKNTKDIKLKKSIRFLIYGISAATLISIFSEYIGPVFMSKFQTSSFMYIAILILVVFLVLAVVKEQFLNVEMEYIYEELFLNSVEAIILVNTDGKVMILNDSARSVLGSDILKKGIYIKDIIENYDFEKDNTRYEINIESRGDLKYLSLSQTVVKIDSKETMKLLHIVDITDNKMEQEAEISLINDKSMRDQLTNLYNRRYFNERFINSKCELKNNMIMFIDIDNFKEVNDKYGHLAGDEVIKIAANIIKDSIRTNEVAIRYGGDEFLVILEDVEEKDAHKIGDRIRRRFVDKIEKEGLNTENISLSIGLSRGDKDIWTLVSEADIAMYYSKSKGKNQCTIYDNGISRNCI